MEKGSSVESSELVDWACRLPLPRDRSTPIGCIGTGFIMADCHLPAYRSAGLNIRGIAGRNPERAQQVAGQHGIPNCHKHYSELLDDPDIRLVDIAVPPDAQADVIKEVVKRKHIRGILAQKPLACHLTEAIELVRLCAQHEVTLAVNQNMRFDQSVRAAHKLIHAPSQKQSVIGSPVLATIDMRAIPHWMPWQERQGWLTCRIMSIHHLDTMRYWFGDPERVYASFTKDHEPGSNTRTASASISSNTPMTAMPDLRRCLDGTGTRRQCERYWYSMANRRNQWSCQRYDWVALLPGSYSEHH